MLSMELSNFTCIFRRLLEGTHVTVKAELCTFCIVVPHYHVLNSIHAVGKKYLDKLIANVYLLGIQKSTIQKGKGNSKWQKRQ
jgi:hypothetical protein